MLTSMDNDGARRFCIRYRSFVSESFYSVASFGGSGNIDHFTDVFNIIAADAALAAVSSTSVRCRYLTSKSA